LAGLNARFHGAVIGGENDDGVIGLAGICECFEELANRVAGLVNEVAEGAACYLCIDCALEDLVLTSKSIIIK
jgi:hypothetical protein